MSIVDAIVNRLGYVKAGRAPLADWLVATGDAGRFSVPDGSLYAAQAEFYQKLTWVHLAVSIVASTCAAVDFTVKERTKEGLKEIDNHPFERLLQRPNPMQSRLEFLEAVFAYRALTGNAYVWLNKASEAAAPEEAWVVASSQIKPVPDGKLYLKGYEYDPGDGRRIALEPWEIVHFKRFHPLNRYVGLSPLEAAAVVAAGELQMQNWNARLFGESNAKLPSVLAFADFVPDDEWERLKKEARDRSRTRDMMMLRNVGKGGVEWIRAAASQKDMEFMGGRKMNRDELLSLFAPGLASMIDVNATEANAVAGKETFVEFSVWPALSAVAEKITNDVLPTYGAGLVGGFEDIRVTNRESDLQEQAEYSKTHTVDEIRMEYYGDKPLGDERGSLLPAEIAKPAQVAPVVAQAERDDPGARRDAAPHEEPLSLDELKELEAWEKFTIKRLGKGGRPFGPKVLRAETAERIGAGLADARTVEDVRAVFAGEKAARGELAPLIEALTEAAKALRETAAVEA
jgi:HK97 family phage portal protein